MKTNLTTFGEAMILENDAIPLLREIEEANESESAATKELHSYMQSGGKDDDTLLALLAKMKKAHNEKMRLHQELQKLQTDHN